VVALQEVAVQSHLLLRGFCLAVAERTSADDFTWLASMPGEADRAITSIAQGFDPRASVERADPRTGERCAYQLSIDITAEPAKPHSEMSLTKIITGAAFEFVPRRALRV
jgi:hypothetical protein